MNAPDPDTQRQIAAFLAGCTTASLATVDERCRPHACNIWYASTADLVMYFVSSPATAHASHIARDPAVALTVYAHVAEPSQIHGLQLHGRCEMLIADADRAAALAVYSARYPTITANEMFRARIASERFYRVTPSWLRWIDNRRGFGFKVEREV